MTKREKVMLALNCCAADDLRTCRECPYAMTVNGIKTNSSTCVMELAADALDLLKEQEARVMTLNEVKRHDNQDGCVWFEQPTYNAVAAFVRQDEECTEIISPYLLGEPINHGYMSNTFYGKAWRCWTSRPTPDQMRNTKWEVTENG